MRHLINRHTSPDTFTLSAKIILLQFYELCHCEIITREYTLSLLYITEPGLIHRSFTESISRYRIFETAAGHYSFTPLLHINTETNYIVPIRSDPSWIGLEFRDHRSNDATLCWTHSNGFDSSILSSDIDFSGTSVGDVEHPTISRKIKQINTLTRVIFFINHLLRNIVTINLSSITLYTIIKR